MKIKISLLVIFSLISFSCSAGNQLDWQSCRASLPQGFYPVGKTEGYFWRELSNNIESVRFIKGKVFDVSDMKKESSYRHLDTMMINGHPVISYSIYDEQLGVDTGTLYSINIEGGIIDLSGFEQDNMKLFVKGCE